MLKKIWLFIIILSFSISLVAQETSEEYCTLSDVTVEQDTLIATLAGDGELTSTPLEIVTGDVAQNVNVRSLPSRSGLVVAVIESGSTAEIVGRDQSSEWLRVNDEDGGWVFADLVSNLSAEIADLPVIGNSNAVIPTLLEYTPAEESDCIPYIHLETTEPSQLIIGDKTYVLSENTSLVVVNSDVVVAHILAGDIKVLVGNEIFYIPAGAKLTQETVDDVVAYEAVPYETDEIVALGLPETIAIAEPIAQTDLDAFIAEASFVPTPAPVTTNNNGNNAESTETAAPSSPNRVVVSFAYSIGITSVPGGGQPTVIGEVQPGTAGTILESQFVGCCTFYYVQFDNGQLGWAEASFFRPE
ncbi:MAG: SH3 domain-containing protein [Anaerolineae bacterium]|jgi:hypothetical protein|nr:SH3 domain-containing protein [Anaerolineae bacterium]